MAAGFGALGHDGVYSARFERTRFRNGRGGREQRGSRCKHALDQRRLR
jgi:hypothetical protein